MNRCHEFLLLMNTDLWITFSERINEGRDDLCSTTSWFCYFILLHHLPIMHSISHRTLKEKYAQPRSRFVKGISTEVAGTCLLISDNFRSNFSSTVENRTWDSTLTIVSRELSLHLRWTTSTDIPSMCGHFTSITAV